MKTKPFNLKAALRGETLVTRNGHRVRNFRKRAPGDLPGHSLDYEYVAQIGDLSCWDSFSAAGSFNIYLTSHPLDLFLMEETESSSEPVHDENLDLVVFHANKAVHYVSKFQRESGMMASIPHESTQKELDRLRTENDRFRAELVDHASVVQALRTELNGLKTDKAKLISEVLDLRRTVEQTRRAHSDLKMKIRDLSLS